LLKISAVFFQKNFESSMELSCFSMQKIERFIEKHVEDLKARTMGRVGPRQSGDRQNPTRASTTRTPFLEKKTPCFEETLQHFCGFGLFLLGRP